MRHSSGKMEAFTIFHSCLNLLILLLHVSGQSLITPGGHSKDTDLEVCTGLIDKMQRIKMKIEKFQELERKLGQMQGKTVFSAWLSETLKDTKANETVIFDAVHINIGSAYCSTTGIFTTPFNGVYGFSWSLMTGPGKFYNTVLVVDEGLIQGNAAYSGDGGKSYESSTNMIILQLKKGQQVWIRKSNNYGNHLRAYYSTFAGWQIE